MIKHTNELLELPNIHYGMAHGDDPSTETMI